MAPSSLALLLAAFLLAPAALAQTEVPDTENFEDGHRMCGSLTPGYTCSWYHSASTYTYSFDSWKDCSEWCAGKAEDYNQNVCCMYDGSDTCYFTLPDELVEETRGRSRYATNCYVGCQTREYKERCDITNQMLSDGTAGLLQASSEEACEEACLDHIIDEQIDSDGQFCCSWRGYTQECRYSTSTAMEYFNSLSQYGKTCHVPPARNTSDEEDDDDEDESSDTTSSHHQVASLDASKADESDSSTSMPSALSTDSYLAMAAGALAVLAVALFVGAVRARRRAAEPDC
eukprot:PLAT2966.1.p1 GENE.PLAT2966.1~~PLAT2966.1.p1  ORF type:complete len:288 (+),score=105.42 PLAT2966.1:47-910(+)